MKDLIKKAEIYYITVQTDWRRAPQRIILPLQTHLQHKERGFLLDNEE